MIDEYISTRKPTKVEVFAHHAREQLDGLKYLVIAEGREEITIQVDDSVIWVSLGLDGQFYATQQWGVDPNTGSWLHEVVAYMGATPLQAARWLRREVTAHNLHGGYTY